MQDRRKTASFRRRSHDRHYELSLGPWKLIRFVVRVWGVALKDRSFATILRQGLPAKNENVRLDSYGILEFYGPNLHSSSSVFVDQRAFLFYCP